MPKFAFGGDAPGLAPPLIVETPVHIVDMLARDQELGLTVVRCIRRIECHFQLLGFPLGKANFTIRK